MAMLDYLIARESSEEAGAVLSLRAIAADFQLNEGQVRLALRKLKGSGLVQVEPREMPNGGTAENAYRVTSDGRVALEAFRAEREDRVAEGVVDCGELAESWL